MIPRRMTKGSRRVSRRQHLNPRTRRLQQILPSDRMQSPPPLPANLNALMEKIRSKSASHKGWPELVKLTKAALVDKRSVLVSDASERSQVEKCLDTIQRCIRVTGLQSMIDRLETITRQLGLKFTVTSNSSEVFISSDMFYVEVVLDPSSGYVKDVKVAHQADPVSCPELTNVLRAADFTEFIKHMDGISAIYQLVADSKTKSKAYVSLHCLETDLGTLSRLQSYVSEPINIIHKTPVGVLEQRKGGHAMKLTFFVSPYDLIDRRTKTALTLNIETVTSKKLGYSANVCIESSARNHKLQTTTLISVQKANDGKNMPCPAAISNLNSTSLPACFVLKLVKQLPISVEVVRKIAAMTTIDFVSAETLSAGQPLVQLVAQTVLSESERTKLTDSQSGADRSFFVRLPDQEHVYYIHEEMPQLQGISLSSIPFTHPTHVPQILVFLRQQVLFNVVIGSCMRKVSSFGTTDPKFTFEVTTQSLSQISVAFEHPVEESLASMEIDLKDITNVKCKLYNPSSFSNLCTDDFASKIMQRSLSIPVTLRMVIVKSREKAQVLREQEIRAQQQQQQQQQENNDLYNYSGNGNDQAIDSTISSFLSQQFIHNFRQNSGNNNPAASAMHHQQQQTQQHAGDGKLAQHLHNVSNSMTAAQKAATQVLMQNLQSQQQQQHQQQNILQRQLQQQGLVVRSLSSGSSPQQIKQNAMLLNMLSDVPAANSSNAVAAFSAYQQQQQSLQNLPTQLQMQLQQQFDFQNQLQKQQQKKVRKRKNTENSSVQTGGRSSVNSTGRSPKRKVSEDEFSRDFELMDATPDQKSVRNASVSGPSFDVGTGTRSLDQLLSGMQASDACNFLQHPSEIPNDLMVNFQMIQRSMGAAAAAAMESDGLSFDQSDFVSKMQGKKRTARTRSSEEEDLMNDSSPDVVRPSSVGPLMGQLQGKGKNAAGGRNASADSGRRCSSAGLGDGSRNRSPFALANSILSESGALLVPALKKDKKRKRSESVDSSMKSGTGSSMSLMPPPLISSTGDVTTSAVLTPTSDSSPPALRPLTLNVKPMTPTSSSDPVQSPGPSAKKTSAVSSSGTVTSPRVVKTDKVKLTKTLVDANGMPIVAGVSGVFKGPKSGVKVNKNGTKTLTQGQSGPKFKQGTGLKLKGSQVTSSSSSVSSLKQHMTVSSPPVSSSTTMGTVSSPSVGSGVSSSKPGLQNSQILKMQLQQQQLMMQQQASNAAAAAAAAAAAVKKPKGSLSAVIDKLSKSVNPIPSSGEGASIGSPPPADSARTETSGPSVSRPDSSSGTKAGSAAKTTGEKTKYQRGETSSPSQPTFKATLSGSKLTISKKPTSSTEVKAGVKMKTTPAVPMKGSPASSSSSASGPSGSSPSSGTKVKGVNLAKKHASVSSFKLGGKASSSVSSSSSSLLSTPPKVTAGRVPGSAKVSSSGATGSQTKEKISSSCGAGAILEEAIPRLRLDQLPKIPKTDKAAQAQAAAAQATAAAAAAAVAASTATPSNSVPSASPATTSSPPSSSVSTPPIAGTSAQPFFRRPGPRDQREQQSVSSASAARSDVSSDRFQSNAITSSHIQASAQNQETLCSSSSSGVLPPDGLQVAALAARVQDAASSSASDPVGSSVSLSSGVNVDKGVTSSSDADEPTSTPSSPVESVMVLEANPPPIIPTESFDDRESGERGRPQTSRIDSTDSRDMEIGHSVYSEEASGGKEGCCSSTSAAESNGGEDEDDGAIGSKDEEDDEDGLVIDVDYSVPTPNSNTPSSKRETPTPGDPVSSSNGPGSDLASGPSSPSPEKSPVAESSSSPAVTPSASSSGFSCSWPTSSLPVVPADVSPAPVVSHTETADPTSSNKSSDPSYSIDDDLMDEALVGSEPAADEPVSDDAPAAPPVAPPITASHHIHEPEPEL